MREWEIRLFDRNKRLIARTFFQSLSRGQAVAYAVAFRTVHHADRYQLEEA